ncbi:MAG: ATP-binding protein [Candidatus Acidiferrales bacterium]
MSVSSNARPTTGAKHGYRVKPKPYSLERRFRLMQAGTVGVTLLLVSMVLFWNLTSERRLESSLDNLNATLALNRLVHSNHQAELLAFWEAYDNEPTSSRQKHDDLARKTTELLQRYDAIPLSAEEQIEVARLGDLHKDFLALTSVALTGKHQVANDGPQRWKLERVSGQMESALGRLEQIQAQHAETLGNQIEESSRWLTFLLLASASFALVALVWFRRAHRNHLWGQLEELRQMVGEVRRGNLNVTGEIPDSIELGSLVRAFLEMASELRETRDLLEQKVIERTAKLETAQKELVQSAKLASLGQLVSGVAHEINNPLTSILGFSEIALGRPGLDPSLRGPLGTIRDEALRLRHLVANLTSFARRAPQRTQVIDLRGVLDRLMDLRNYQLQSDNIVLHLIKPIQPVWVIADPDQLLQVLLNLVMNSTQSIKDCRDHGEIQIACGTDAYVAWLTVKDNGAGMADDVREHIFDPFFTTKPTGQGTGLGLSISHGIVQQHRGAIVAESKLGEGTLMRITLPLAAEAPPENQKSPATNRPEKKAQRPEWHALVVDDEKDILEMVEQALERLKCRSTLLLGSGGVEAALDKEKFDFVISDLKMPGKNGLDVYRMIRAKYPDLANRFLLMTGNLADADEHDIELEAVPILSKPFTLARLREAVEQLLHKQTPA